MKTSKATVIGALILVFSLTVPLVVVACNSGIFTPRNTPNTPTPNPTMVPTTNSPTPTPTTSPSTNGDYQVKITEFSSRGGWFCPGGVAMVILFDVDILNNGMQNLTNSTLIIKRTQVSNDDLSIRQTLSISSGETVHASGEVWTDINRYTSEFRGSTYTATITLNGVVLDEKTIEITGSQF